MLVLQRHEHDRISITVPPSDEVTVIVVELVEIRPHVKAARIGFEAPREVQILRDDAIVKTSAGQAASGRCE